MAGKRKAVLNSAASDSRIDEDDFRIHKADYSALENIFLDWGYQQDEWWQKAKTRFIKIDENDDGRRVKVVRCPAKLLWETQEFKSLHPSIGQLQALDELGLFWAEQIKNLPNEIGNLRSLTKLYLQRSGVTSLPPSIGQLQALRELRLWSTEKLMTLPEEIGNLSNLIFLDLRSSGIKSLPSSIGRLHSLKQLDLRNTVQLSNLPKEIGNLGNLIRLDLQHSEATLSPSIEYALACSRFRSRSSTMDQTGIRFKATRWPIILENATNAFRPNDKGDHPSTRNCEELRGLEPHDAIYRFLVDGRESFLELLINRNEQNYLML